MPRQLPGAPSRRGGRVLDPDAVRAAVRAVLAEVGSITPERIARNGPTVGVLLACYLVALLTLASR